MCLALLSSNHHSKYKYIDVHRRHTVKMPVAALVCDVSHQTNRCYSILKKIEAHTPKQNRIFWNLSDQISVVQPMRRYCLSNHMWQTGNLWYMRNKIALAHSLQICAKWSMPFAFQIRVDVNHAIISHHSTKMTKTTTTTSISYRSSALSASNTVNDTKTRAHFLFTF